MNSLRSGARHFLHLEPDIMVNVWNRVCSHYLLNENGNERMSKSEGELCVCVHECVCVFICVVSGTDTSFTYL